MFIIFSVNFEIITCNLKETYPSYHLPLILSDGVSRVTRRRPHKGDSWLSCLLGWERLIAHSCMHAGPIFGVIVFELCRPCSSIDGKLISGVISNVFDMPSCLDNVTLNTASQHAVTLKGTYTFCDSHHTNSSKVRQRTVDLECLDIG